jgi:DNA-directed RNA polymerase specialized sigma subunit
MMIINVVEIAYAISRKLPIPKNIFEKAKYIARFQDYEFIDKFLNNDEYVARELNMPIEEVKENFTKGMRLRFAIYNISNPIEGLKRVKEHLETTLTDENLAKVFNMTIEEVRENFTKGMILRFAISNISNPIEGLKRVKEHLETTLTDENLAKVFNMTIEEVRENFTKGMRLYFAINNISNPIKGLQKWLEGKIKAPFKKPTIKP